MGYCVLLREPLCIEIDAVETPSLAEPLSTPFFLDDLIAPEHIQGRYVHMVSSGLTIGDERRTTSFDLAIGAAQRPRRGPYLYTAEVLDCHDLRGLVEGAVRSLREQGIRRFLLNEQGLRILDLERSRAGAGCLLVESDYHRSDLASIAEQTQVSISEYRAQLDQLLRVVERSQRPYN